MCFLLKQFEAETSQWVDVVLGIRVEGVVKIVFTSLRCHRRAGTSDISFRDGASSPASQSPVKTKGGLRRGKNPSRWPKFYERLPRTSTSGGSLLDMERRSSVAGGVRQAAASMIGGLRTG